jgi:sugar phosphate permease
MSSSLARRQATTVALLFTGYAAYYFCRSDLSVAMPMLTDELHRAGIPQETATVRMGGIVSFGVLAYALGKLFLGGLGDLWGGRRSFLTGLAGAVAFTLLFTLGGGLPLFSIAWIGNRLIQSTGWAGLVKVCSRWFDYTSYGTVIALLSLSFLIGDAAARESMGMLIQHGYGWRELFYFAAAVAGIVLTANLLFLRDARNGFGFPEPKVNPLNVFRTAKSRTHAVKVRTLLIPLLSSRNFWIVCFLSLGTTIIRETFNTWTPTYLHSHFLFSNASAARASAIFPGVGIFSVILAGWAGDRLGVSGRSIILFVGMLLTTAGLFVLAGAPASWQGVIPLLLLGIVAFGLLGPYSYLAGAMALDFGGERGGAMSSGIIDGVGYLGGVLAGDTAARLSVDFGWSGVFVALALVSGLSAGGAGLLFVQQRHEAAKLEQAQ